MKKQNHMAIIVLQLRLIAFSCSLMTLCNAAHFSFLDVRAWKFSINYISGLLCKKFPIHPIEILLKSLGNYGYASFGNPSIRFNHSSYATIWT